MQTLPITKICTACKRDLPFESYHKHATAKFGLRPKCKDCIHVERTDYYAKNASAKREYSREYYAQNAERVIQYQAAYSQKHRKKIAARSKVWREANRDYLKQAKKVDYQRNKKHYLALSRIYTKQNPQYSRAGVIRRRARIANAPGYCSPAQWLARCEYYGFRCYLCHVPLTLKLIRTEHRIPLCRGGSNWPSNLAPACHPCNAKKHKMTEKEFRNSFINN
jgi:5-methylcytosine-specific restriction endonuclease McrA